MASHTDLTHVLMVRDDLAGLPDCSVPGPCQLRWFHPGDEQAWTGIMRAADRYNEITGEVFEREFGSDGKALSQRQCYLCDPDGRPIGTSTGWFNDHYPGQPYGRIHWVAIIPERQGRGLAKPLLSATCKRLRELGHTKLYLTTETPRLPAINLYLKFGFRPEIRNEADRRAWENVAKHLRSEALAAHLRGTRPT
jgi:GNAT superfamily N-acetyltransferase